MKVYFFLILITLGFLTSCEESITDDLTTNNQENVPLGDAVTASVSTEMQNNEEVVVVEFDRLPLHIQRFEESQVQIDDTPQGAAAMFLIALHTFRTYPNEGVKSLVTACGGAAIRASDGEIPSYKGEQLLSFEYFRIKDQIERYPNLATAYFEGASPANNYTPNQPYQMEFTRVQDLGTSVKVYIRTEGADSDRPIRVLKEGDKWRVDEYSSVLSGIKE